MFAKKSPNSANICNIYVTLNQLYCLFGEPAEQGIRGYLTSIDLARLSCAVAHVRS